MSDFGYIISQLRGELDSVKQRLEAIETKLANDTAADDVREQGHAIRNMTMVLERVVNQVFPELEKPQD